MFSIPHLVIIFIVVLVVFGPHKLPELARGLGKIMAEFRKASTDFKMAFEEEMRTIERQTREAEWKKSQEAAAAASAQEQPVTLAAPAPETKYSLSESPITTEPTISPVSESVARDAQSSSVYPGVRESSGDPQTGAAPGSSDDNRITEGTPPSEPESASTLDAAKTDSDHASKSGGSPRP